MMDVRRDIPAGEPEADLEGQARAWIVRLRSGVATEQDLLRLAGWRAASPAAEAAFDRARVLWAMMGPVLEADGERRLVPFRRRVLSRRGLIGGGVTAIAAGAAGVAYLGALPGQASDPGETIVATEKGERRRIILADDVTGLPQARLAAGVEVDGMDLLRGEAVVAVADAPRRLVARVGHTAASTRKGEFLLRREGKAASILCLWGVVFAASGE